MNSPMVVYWKNRIEIDEPFPLENEVIMSRLKVHTEKAPKAIGPYSQAIKTDFGIYTAGQLGLDPATGELVSESIEDQTRQALQNLQNILEAGESDLDHVVKTIVFLKDMNDFVRMNSVYAEFFGEFPPARSTVAVAGLPKGALVEIEAFAVFS